MAAAEEEEAVPLSEPLMDLSKIGKTLDGKGYAYHQLDCVGKKVGLIKCIETYTNLRQVDLSKNLIKDVTPLKDLGSLLKLALASNAIKTIKPWEEGPAFAHLLYLDLSENGLTALPPLAHMANLKFVNLAQNEIATCEESGGHEKIEELDLSQNKLEALEGFGNYPALLKLKLGSNEIPSFSGVTALPELTELDLSKNQLSSLTGAWSEAPNIKKLHVAENKLETGKACEDLRQLPKLRVLEVAGNPMSEAGEEQTRLEMLICHWNLATINGSDVTEEEKNSAKELNKERMEAARIKAEEEAAAAAAAEDA